MNLPKSLKVILAGSAYNQEYSDMIRTLIKELKLEDIIEMHGSVEDTASLLASAECGVLTCVSEGLPVALLEYGMAALPVVVTDVGQCSEVVSKGVYGRVVLPKNPGEVANALQWIIENQFMAKEIGEKFCEHVNMEYGPDKFMKEYAVLLNRLSTE